MADCATGHDLLDRAGRVLRCQGREQVAPREGLEPSTYPLGGGRAIQLCHRG